MNTKLQANFERIIQNPVAADVSRLQLLGHRANQEDQSGLTSAATVWKWPFGHRPWPGLLLAAFLVGSALAPPARAQTPLPDDFNPGATGGDWPSVSSLAVQADGKILVGGDFTNLCGQTRNYLGRLNADGTLDTGFNPGANDYVFSLAVQADGKILVGGGFTTLGGQPRNNLGRLNADGTLDTGFNPGANDYVFSLAVQADGKILVGGWFSTLGGQPRDYIGRLNADGTLDAGFDPGTDGAVISLAVQADGKIVVGGWFTTLGGQPRNSIGRLNANGTLDTGFNPGVGPEYSSFVFSLAVQADGKIVVGGDFTTLGGQPRNGFGRLNANGTLDTGFDPGTDGGVSSLAVQADGKILVGGYFTTLGGQPRNGIGRLNANGTLDTGFNPGTDADGRVGSLAVQADGKILVGGGFTTLGGQPRSNIGRLNATDPATQSLTSDGSSITWLRGGTSPEVWRTTFAHSPAGVAWTDLGAGTRIPGGWQRTGLSLPPGGTIRARGYVSGGGINGWFVEASIGAPALVTQPSSRTNEFGTTASFSVHALGTEPLSYQWYQDGVALADGPNIVGALTPSLGVSNVLGSDAGRYRVVVANTYGSVTSSVAILTVLDPLITVQPVGQPADPGGSVTFSVTAAGTEPLAYQWWKDGVALPQGSGASLTLDNLQFTDAGLYTVVVSNLYGSVTSAPAPLTINLVTVDAGFNPGANSTVNSLAVQADGKILVGGGFTTLGGQTRNRIGRLNPDGTLDTDFNPGANDYVYSLAVQADGKTVVGGGFTTLGGQTRNSIGRLNADGTLDTEFSPGADDYDYVFSLAVQADGKTVVGGSFTWLGGQTRNRIGRLNADGTLDTGFDPGATGASYPRVSSLAVQADGKIVVGGSFTNLCGQPRENLGRLNADGTLDTGFDPGTDGGVSSLAVQADGKILVGGRFTTLGGQTRNYLGRLNADGTLDTGFDPGANSTVYSLAVQADGKIVVGGSFTNLCGQTRNYLGRLNADGTLDAGFDPGASSTVYSLALQSDGRIVVGGAFTSLGGQTRNRIGRLNATDPATQSLTADGSTITWLRGGTSPEVWRTTFEHSPDGVAWTDLGPGMRIAGGWQVSGLSLPPGGTIRARGHVTGGLNNGSSWFVEASIGALVLGTQPSSRTNEFGTTASFSVYALGTEPSYQWYKDGVALADGPKIAGALTPTLTLSSVVKSDEAGYHAVVTTAQGSVTSVVATLTVIDPFIIGQPVSQKTNAGDSVTLSVTAGGTEPLAYQWWKDGAALAQGTGASLTLDNLQGTDAGFYTVVVSNLYGSVTSAPALLTINLAAVDAGFDPGASNSVSSLAVQADGKIVVGGSFTNLCGQTRNRIGRLNADGTLDAGFNPGASGSLSSLAVQADGKILVVGYFSTLGGQTRSKIGRLNPDGTLDPYFNPGATGGYPTWVGSLAVQADGKVLVAGSFTTLGGQTRNRIARLNADGTLDAGFDPGANEQVLSLAVQADGKIVVGGGFTRLAGQPRYNIGRLNADGTLDTGFDPGAGGGVNSLAVQADGKIVVGGSFTSLGGQTRNRIGRLNADGSLDTGFNPGLGGGDYVSSLAVQADGKIVVGGDFTTLAGQPRNRIGRLNPDGTLDLAFEPGASSSVYSLAVQADGKIVVGGDFTTLAGQPRNRIGRLNATDPATQSLTSDGSSITWLRGGTSPEVWRTTFAHSPDGTAWTDLGAGTRITGLPAGQAGGWQVTGLSLPPGGTILARGYVTGGDNGSSWFVEATIGPPIPILYTQASSRTNNAGTTARFSVYAGGSEPLSYQWYKDGVALADGLKIAGALTPTLNVSNVLGSDAGGYHVVVTDAQGSVTSQVATLTVVDPVITGQPASQTGNLDESVTFSVTAVATEPLAYQWWKDGVALGQGTGASLTLTNLQFTDAGLYSVVVSNLYGSVTSQVATLTVQVPEPGVLDPSFATGAAIVGTVYSLGLQSDGKVVVGGSFTSVDGTSASGLAQLNADGSRDTDFALPTLNGAVNAVAIQPDGKVLAGGAFTTVNGTTRNRIARLNANGTLDTDFNPSGGANSTISALALQPDGGVLVGGAFTTMNGVTRYYVARLNANGTLDTSFVPPAISGGTVSELVLQRDGGVVIAGTFTTVGGVFRGNLARLHPNGSLDTSFAPGQGVNLALFTSTDSPGLGVTALEALANGKVLAGGVTFSATWSPDSSGGLGRYTPDGWLDPSYLPGVMVTNSYSASLQVNVVRSLPDGRTLIGGVFPSVNGIARRGVARVGPDGRLDLGFDPGSGVNGTVYDLAVQPDGRLIIAGNFNQVRGVSSAGIARFIGDDGPPVVGRQPQGTNVAAGFNAEFSVVLANGRPPWACQWFFNGTEAVPGATNFSLTLSNVQSTDAGAYHVVISNALGSVASAPAVLTVSLGPTLLSAGSADGTTVGLCFDVPVTLASAQNPANYLMSGGGRVTNATLRPDGQTVVLALQSPVASPFTVTASGIADAQLGHLGGGTVRGRVEGLTAMDIGSPTPVGSTFVGGEVSFEVIAGGTDIWGTSDQGHFVLTQQTGDFDVKVRVAGLTALSRGTKAGLSVRQSTAANSPNVHLNTLPPPPARGSVDVGIRSAAGSSTTGWAAFGPNNQWLPATTIFFPDAWLRMQRAGSYFRAYVSRNGWDWILAGQTTLSWSTTLWVGLEANAHASFRDFGPYEGPLVEALETPGRTWITSGNRPWFAQTAVTHDDRDALQSGPITDGQTSVLETTLNGPGTLSFWWKVSSEPANDRLVFAVDGVEQFSITGEVDWEQRILFVPSGSAVARWTYTKSASGSAGADAAWLDQVSYESHGSLAPEILAQPVDQAVMVGTSTAFSVLCQGVPPLSYQWQFNDTAIPGATNATLTLDNVQFAQAGPYAVVVSNEQGTVESDVAYLSVSSIAILNQPVSVVLTGSTNLLDYGNTTNGVATFNVVAFGDGPLTYQWRFNGVPIFGATGDTLPIAEVNLSHQGVYDVVVSDSLSSMVSDPARLDLLMTPVIVVAPLNQVVPVGGCFSASVSVRGSPPPFMYQWRRGSTIIAVDVSDSTNSVFTYGPVTTVDQATWRVALTNAASPQLTSLTKTFTVTVQADADGDLLPDPWELANGFSPSDPSDASADLDGDGMTLLEECIAGTDWTDPSSYLRVDGISVPGTALIEFHAVSNRTYSVEFKNDPSAAIWSKLLDVFADSTNRTVQVLDPSPANAPQRIYRLVVPAQP